MELSWIPYIFVIIVTFISSIKTYDLTVLHTNDVHAHFVEFNAQGGNCPKEHSEAGKCFGGFARQVTKAKEVREKNKNVVFLNGGDFFQGTVWYTLHRYKVVAEFVNVLGIDAMSLGNHEFDDGLKDLIPYLESVKPKVVVCNIDSSEEPDIQRLVKPSTVLEIGGEKIGVIGYLTPLTKFLSSTGKLEFFDEVECIKKEAKHLSEQGINKIIAVGHSGLDDDLRIAKEVPEVDIVVGGHTNSFLYNGEPPSIEVPQGPYPLEVVRADNSKALVVQDFAFGKYMGFLQVTFTDDGKLDHWSGNPILLDSSVKEDPEVLELLKPYADEVIKRGKQEVGRTNVLLCGNRDVCRMKECNLGNFLADAALDYFISEPTEKGWSNVAIAMWNSGGIRGTIDERINNGSVILEDVLMVAPFGNTMDIVGLKGKHLREVLESSVKRYDHQMIDPPGSLLQVSGLKIIYNVLNPPDHRVVDVKVRCADCRIPTFEPLEDERVYEIVMPTYLTKGGDAFSLIPKYSLSNRNTDELDVDIITAYMKKQKPIIHGLEDRITVISSEINNQSNMSKEPILAILVDSPLTDIDAIQPQITEVMKAITENHTEELTTIATTEQEQNSTSRDVFRGLQNVRDNFEKGRGRLQEGMEKGRERLQKGMEQGRERLQEGMKKIQDDSKKFLEDATKRLPFPGFGKLGDLLKN